MGPFIPRLSRDHCQPSRHGAVTAARVPRIKLPISISVALSPHQTPYSPPQAYQSKTAHFLETAIWTTDQNLKVLKRDNEIKGKGTAFEFPRVPCITPEQVAAPGAVRSDWPDLCSRPTFVSTAALLQHCSAWTRYNVLHISTQIVLYLHLAME